MHAHQPQPAARPAQPRTDEPAARTADARPPEAGTNADFRRDVLDEIRGQSPEPVRPEPHVHVGAPGEVIAERLEHLRQRTRRAIEEDRRAEGTPWRAHLLPAAQELLVSLEEIFRDTALWSRLEHAEAEVVGADAVHLERIERVLRLDLAALLDHIGYRPPPAVDVLVDDMAEALWTVARPSSPTGSAAGRARRDLGVFTFRLRGLIAEAEASRPSADHGNSTAEDGATRHRVVTAMEQVMPALAAASLAAVVDAGFLGAAGDGIGLGAAITLASREVLKVGVEAGVLGLFTRRSAEDERALRARALALAWARVDLALDDLVEGLEAPGHPGHPQASVLEVSCLEALSALYAFGQATLASDVAPALSRHVAELVTLTTNVPDAVTMGAWLDADVVRASLRSSRETLLHRMAVAQATVR